MAQTCTGLFVRLGTHFLCAAERRGRREVKKTVLWHGSQTRGGFLQSLTESAWFLQISLPDIVVWPGHWRQGAEVLGRRHA